MTVSSLQTAKILSNLALFYYELYKRIKEGLKKRSREGEGKKQSEVKWTYPETVLEMFPEPHC